MPNPPVDQKLVVAYADAFAQHQFLKQNGFAFLIDISGKLFKPKGSVALRDIEGNVEALCYTVMFWVNYSYRIFYTLLPNYS